MPTRTAASVALLLGLATTGCGVFHRAPPLPPILVFQPPILFPAPPPAPMPPPTSYAVDGTPPDFTFVMPVGPPPRPAPRRVPEVAAEAPPVTDNAPPPPLTPAFSPQQQAGIRNQALAILQRARKDLATLAGRRLFGGAAATRAQAGEYVRQAEQALQEGDVMRAQTLATKAETLARFLLGQ